MNPLTYKLLKDIAKQQQETKDLIMTIIDDMNSFISDINVKTNEIAAALDEIKTDIETLLANAGPGNTPPELVTAMEEMRNKLAALSASATSIAALDDSVEEPPPEEPPL